MGCCAELDYEMYLMTKKIRGEISQCIIRYSKSDNKYLNNCVPSKPENYLLYVDNSNLHGWASSQKLSYKDLMFIQITEV